MTDSNTGNNAQSSPNPRVEGPLIRIGDSSAGNGAKK